MCQRRSKPSPALPPCPITPPDFFLTVALPHPQQQLQRRRQQWSWSSLKKKRSVCQRSRVSGRQTGTSHTALLPRNLRGEVRGAVQERPSTAAGAAVRPSPKPPACCSTCSNAAGKVTPASGAASPLRSRPTCGATCGHTRASGRTAVPSAPAASVSAGTCDATCASTPASGRTAALSAAAASATETR